MDAASADDPALRAKVLLVHERLCAEYRCPIAFFHEMEPMNELVSSLLSHRTKNADSARAFRQLRARLATWDAVRDAPTAEVEALIAPATWPEQKAPRIQAVLREIGERRGTLGDDALDFLAELPVVEARAWLESITGVGPKTSAAVLLFSRLRRPALPVDSHHHRVALRLGLLPPNVAVGPAHALLEAQLPADWDAQQVYDNHEALMLHGQRCCFHHDPACDRCVVLDLCPTGQARLARRAPAPSERSLPLSGVAARPVRPPRSRTVASAGYELDLTAGSPATEDVPMANNSTDPNDVREGSPPSTAGQSAGQRAHGTHGKGGNEEELIDPQATDTGDDAQLRNAGGGGDSPPSPEKFRKQALGHMGGAGWGSEAVGGSVVDRRPPDPDTGKPRRHG